LFTKLIQILFIVLILSSSTFASLTFEDSLDVESNADFSMIIINLTNSSQADLDQIRNKSRGYLINYTIDPISPSRASRINSKNWIWYNRTFYEISPIIFKGEYIKELNLSFGKAPFLRGIFNNLKEQDSCEHIKFTIFINQSKIKADYPSFEPANNLVFEWEDHQNHQTISRKVTYEEGEYVFDYDDICLEKKRVYPFDIYQKEFEVFAEYSYPEEVYPILGIDEPGYFPDRDLSEEPKLIYWGMLEHENKTVKSPKAEDKYISTASFKDYNILVTQKRKNTQIFIFGLFIFYILIFFKCKLKIRSLLITDINTKRKFNSKLWEIFKFSIWSLSIPVIAFFFDGVLGHIASPSILLFIPGVVAPSLYLYLRKNRIVN